MLIILDRYRLGQEPVRLTYALNREGRDTALRKLAQCTVGPIQAQSDLTHLMSITVSKRG